MRVINRLPPTLLGADTIVWLTADPDGTGVVWPD
jgi:hypothetical protein